MDNYNNRAGGVSTDARRVLLREATLMKENWSLAQIAELSEILKDSGRVQQSRILIQTIGILANVPPSDFLSLEIKEGVKAGANK